MTSALTLLAAWFGRCQPAERRHLTLAPGATMALKPRCGARLVVAEGQAWITQAGDPRDHLPESGETVTLADRGLVVVQNLADRPLTAHYWRLLP